MRFLRNSIDSWIFISFSTLNKLYWSSQNLWRFYFPRLCWQNPSSNISFKLLRIAIGGVRSFEKLFSLFYYIKLDWNEIRRR